MLKNLNACLVSKLMERLVGLRLTKRRGSLSLLDGVTAFVSFIHVLTAAGA